MLARLRVRRPLRDRTAGAAVAFVLLALAPGPAEAADVYAVGKTAYFWDHSFQRNRVIVTAAPRGGIRFRDRLAPLRIGRGCRRVGKAAVCRRASKVEIHLGDGDDVAVEAVARSSIWGQQGNDTIIERPSRGEPRGGRYLDGPEERKYGNTGDDIVRAGEGPDEIVGGAGSDTLSGGPGGDFLNGGLGPDDVWVDGDDTINAGPGDDALVGGPGADTLTGDAGADVLDAGLGDDVVLGGPGADDLRGGPDPLRVVGATETDVDRLDGGVGDDRLDGAIGADRLDGGPGVDTLQYIGPPGVMAPPPAAVSFDGLANDGPLDEGDSAAGVERLLTRPTIELSTGEPIPKPGSFDDFRGDWLIEADHPSDVRAAVSVLGPAGTADALEAQVSSGDFLLPSGTARVEVQLHGGNEGHTDQGTECPGTVSAPGLDAGDLDDRRANPRSGRSRHGPEIRPDVTARAAWHLLSRRLRIGLNRGRALLAQVDGTETRTLRVVGARAAAQLDAGDDVVVADSEDAATQVRVLAGAVEVTDCLRGTRHDVGAGQTYLVSD